MTTQEEIELLAEFDGFVRANLPFPFEDIFRHPDKMGLFGWPLQQKLLYHKSYDWLIPVWHKFRDLKIENSNLRFNEFLKGGADPIFSLHKEIIASSLAWGSLTDFYNALVKAVQWYNSITSKQ